MMVPLIVERTMKKLCSSLRERNVKIDSVHVYGSIALGDFIEGSSDIDFIAILSEPHTMSDIAAITMAHEEVENEFPQTDIMGAYLLKRDLGKAQSDIQSPLTYFNKQVYTDGRGSDLNPVTWWILKKHGITVHGPSQPLDFEVDENMLMNYVVGNLNTYWKSWIGRLEEQMDVHHLSDEEHVTRQLDEAVEWCTLGMLRQLYTIKEHDIKSKVEAGYYGIRTVPERWHGLIYEAINIKRLLPGRFYYSNEKRLTDLLVLLRYIHAEANRAFDEQGARLT